MISEFPIFSRSDRSCFRLIWKWQVPLKQKIFTWLAGRERLLTWEALRHRGWEGPGRCSLCKQESEDIHHLLVHCFFTKQIWNLLINFFHIPVAWKGPTFSACLTDCITQKSAPPTLAVCMCWQVWKERNSAIFEDRIPSILAVFHRVRNSFQWQPALNKTFTPKVYEISLSPGYSLACFDGAAESTGLCCGAGGFFRTHSKRITKWFMNCGEGTNTKAELLGLWTSLALASFWSIDHLLVLGDSRVVIDWISQKSLLRSVNIEAWKDKIQGLSNRFLDISYRHISRSFNNEADALSKRALGGVSGRLSIFHCENGSESNFTHINLFEGVGRES